MTVKVPEKSKVVVGTHFASIDKEGERRHTDALGNTGGPGESRGRFLHHAEHSWKPNDLGRVP